MLFKLPNGPCEGKMIEVKNVINNAGVPVMPSEIRVGDELYGKFHIYKLKEIFISGLCINTEYIYMND